MKLKVCPRCGSIDVKWIIPQNWSRWVCKDCSYVGPIIEGDPELAIEIRKKYIKELEEGIEREEIEDDEDLSDEEIAKKIDELYE